MTRAEGISVLASIRGDLGAHSLRCPRAHTAAETENGGMGTAGILMHRVQVILMIMEIPLILRRLIRQYAE